MSLATPPARDYWSTKKDHLYSSCVTYVTYVIEKAIAYLPTKPNGAADGACFRESLYAVPDPAF